jgi:hypothetical protein
MDREAAAEKFAAMLFREGVEEGLKAFFDGIENPLGHQGKKWERIRRLLHSQSEEGKRTFRLAIAEAMTLAVFGIAVHLDGASGGIEMGDRSGRFAAALNIYGSWKDSWKQPPEETVQICPTFEGEDVHDLFMDLADQWEKAQSL